MLSWDERYGAEGYAYGTAPNDFLAEQAPRYLEPGDEVLSLGEGEGRNAVFLAGLDFAVTGVDSSPVGLDKAQRLARDRGVSIKTICADLASHELGTERWDAIVSIWCHLPSAVRRRVHAAVTAALKPGGYFILEAYTPEQLALQTGGPKSLDLLASLETLRAELAGLEWLVAGERQRDVQEGSHHHGLSAVVQLVGRKPERRP